MSALQFAEDNVKEQLVAEGFDAEDGFIQRIIAMLRKEYGDNAWAMYHGIENDIIFTYEHRFLWKNFKLVIHVRDIPFIKKLVTDLVGPEQ